MLLAAYNDPTAKKFSSYLYDTINNITAMCIE